MKTSKEPPLPSPFRLLAPITGHIVPLEDVPDPIFSQRVVGDGVSIDPLGSSVVAPCEGKILHAHGAGHALTIRADNGVEVMIHVGVDTVHLKGEGFTLKTRAGDRVSAGQRLIEVDLDRVARKAKSLLTQALITNLEGRLISNLARGDVIAGETCILEISPAAPKAIEEITAGTRAESEAISVQNPMGLHARPASILAREAKKYHSIIHIKKGERLVNAKSLVAIMTLDVKGGDAVNLIAEGPDAAEAIQALAKLISLGLHEGIEGRPAPTILPNAPAKSEDRRALAGVCASPGLAIGKCFHFKPAEIAVPEKGEDVSVERAKISEGVERAKAEIEILQKKLAASKGAAEAAIFGAHRELLEDPELLEIAESAIEKGASAALAWRCACEEYSERLARLDNKILAGRAADIADVGRRVLRVLAGAPSERIDVPQDSIVIAEDLSPSDFASFDWNRVAGVCTIGGSGSSHGAILCRSFGVPALAAVEPRLLSVPEGAPLILEASKGLLLTEPSAEELSQSRKVQDQLRYRKTSEKAASKAEAKTRDGRIVRVFANIGKESEAEKAAEHGAEGVGLCRTEFLFLNRNFAPSETEQVRTYSAIKASLPNGEVVIRLLDVGGDKHLSYIPLAKENNPFLGKRGIRLLLDRLDLLATQVRAILLASRNPGGKLKILIPMISGIEELRATQNVITKESERLGIPPLPVGVMIEVPSAALVGNALARESDFFSIGTNDLSQYTLAMDRDNPKMAPNIDALNPGVLFMIERAVAGARSHGRPVTVCGGAAGDPLAIPILIGLGVDALSVSPGEIPTVKALIRKLSQSECRELSQRALGADSSCAARSYSASFMEKFQ